MLFQFNYKLHCHWVQLIVVFVGKRFGNGVKYSLERDLSDFGSVLGSEDVLWGSGVVLLGSLETEGSEELSGSATTSLVGSGLAISGSLTGSEVLGGSPVGSEVGSAIEEDSLEGSETVVGSATVGSGSAVVKGSPVGSGVVSSSDFPFLLVPKYLQ